MHDRSRLAIPPSDQLLRLGTTKRPALRRLVKATFGVHEVWSAERRRTARTLLRLGRALLVVAAGVYRGQHLERDEPDARLAGVGVVVGLGVPLLGQVSV